MLPLTGKDVHRFTPPGREGEADAPVYLIATPTPMGRARYRQAMLAEGLRYWSRTAFCAAARDWLEQIAPENLEELLEVVSGIETLTDETEATSGADPDARPVEPDSERLTLLAKWGELSTMLTEQSPRVAKMAGDNKLFLDMTPYLAASLFVVGWENVPVAFRRGADRLVPMELLGELDEGDLGAVWLKIMSLMDVTAAQRKNSASPSGLHATANPSTTAPAPRTAAPGTSTARKSR